MEREKRNILFIRAGWPNQFSPRTLIFRTLGFPVSANTHAQGILPAAWQRGVTVGMEGPDPHELAMNDQAEAACGHQPGCMQD
jgi:hypothetical protein